MGKMSRDKGARFERDLAKYLRPEFSKIDRAVRTGYRTATRTAVDPGDLHGSDYIIWSAKDVGDGEPAPGMLRLWLAEVETMVIGISRAPDPVGVLVHKRRGHADVGMAWAWLTVSNLGRVLGPLSPWKREPVDRNIPVRVRLGDILPGLVAWERRCSGAGS